MRPSIASLVLLPLLGCATPAPPRRHLAAPPPPELAPLVATPVPAPTNPAAEPAPSGVVVSRDGRTRTRRGPCQPDAPAPTTALVACTTGADGHAREWSDPDGGALLDVYDGAALITRDGEVFRFDIDLARETPLSLPEPTARWLRAGFTASGMLVGLVRTGTLRDPRTSWVHGPGAGPLAMEDVPVDADDIDTADDTAVCVGAGTGAAVSALGWRRRITFPSPGPHAVSSAQTVRRAGERVRCDAGRCVVDGMWVVQLSHTGDTNDPTSANFR